MGAARKTVTRTDDVLLHEPQAIDQESETRAGAWNRPLSCWNHSYTYVVKQV